MHKSLLKTTIANNIVLEIDVTKDECVYKVDGNKVSRDDFNAIVAALNAASLDELSKTFHANAEEGVCWELSLIRESLDPRTPGTLAHRALAALGDIAEK